MISSHYSAINRKTIKPSLWDTFVAASDEAWLWHLYDFQDALATWPGYLDLSFAVTAPENSEEFLAVVPLHLVIGKAFHFLRWSILHSQGGPACKNELGSHQKTKVISFIRNHLIEKAREYKCTEIRLAVSPLAPAYRGENCPRVNPLLEYGCENTLTQTCIINLLQPEKNLWEQMEVRARNAVRKAEKAGVTVRTAKTIEDIKRYYEMHCETYRRTGAQMHPFEYFAKIWEFFGTSGLSWIFLAEQPDKKIIGAVNAAFYKNAGMYWTGASSSEALALGVNNLLQWHAILHLKEAGCCHYEIGEVFPNASAGKIKGLTDFKKSFGGIVYPLYRGTIVQRPFLKLLRQTEGVLFPEK